MNYRILALLLLLLPVSIPLAAQAPFTEGTLDYKVKLRSADGKVYKGHYKFTFKGPHVKKELNLDNGFEDVVLIDCGTGSVHSLQNRNGKKYAIQLKMDDITKVQQPFTAFTLSSPNEESKTIAGYAAVKGKVTYKDGSSADIYYSKEWYPLQAITFERFPAARFLPLYFAYIDEHGIAMEFDADKLEMGPQENAVFRIPADYKMISNDEYKQLSK